MYNNAKETYIVQSVFIMNAGYYGGFGDCVEIVEISGNIEYSYPI